MSRPTAAFLAALLTFSVTAGTASAAGVTRFRSSEVIDGPDVASYQHPYGAAINWRAVARTDKDFAIVKATEGTSYKNPWFHRDYDGARKAGLVRGSYHFARPAYPLDRTARHQASFFVAHLGNVRTANTLPPALDLESTGGLSRGSLVTWAQLFLLQVRKLTGRAPLIYTYPSFWTGALGDPAALARYPLWMASYSGPATDSATLWQYTSGAHVSGIRGRVDMSVFTEPTESWDGLRDGRTPSPWPAAAPGSPAHVDANAGDGSIAVTWLPGDTGSSAVQHYRVTAVPNDGSPQTSMLVPGTTTQATLHGLTNGLSYAVTVTGANTRGYGTASDIAGPVTPLVPTALTVGGPTSFGFGDDARVAIQLTRPDRSGGLAGRTLTIDQRVHGASGNGWQPWRTVSTDRHGWVVLHVHQPQHTADLRFSYTGPAGWRNVTRVVGVVIRNRATAALSRRHLRQGQKVTLRGHGIPALAGVQVVRQSYYGGRWHSIESTTSAAHGNYAFPFAPPTKGVHVYRVVVPGFDGRAHGYSPIRRVHVRK
jgi:GH25 family lysozyme M1 (1,4-beta-N-acetylmuramidase)